MLRRPRAILILLLLSASAAPAAERWRVFDPPRQPKDARLGAAVTLDGYHPWEPYRDLDAWRERARVVRRQILVAAGLWPMPPAAPLEPVVRGRIDRGDYTIEKVHFQSYPGVYITGNLYRPAALGGRRPAVLSPHGHWRSGRFYELDEAGARRQIDGGKEKTLAGARYPLQARCAQLTRMGCIVFHYDMVGYADLQQIGHAAGFGDVEAELRLQSAFGLQTYNTLRAFDFLAGLPDVDPARIGVTGASGGGTQTFILCAIDERPAAAFPAVMVSTAMQGGCACENASHLRVGTGNIEFAALAAPRPYAMTGANDWTIDIETKGLPELKALWSAFGAADKVEARCFPAFEHNYNQVSRELMYGWFNRHLRLGHAEPVSEQPFEPVPPAELAVFGPEHPPPADAAGIEKLRAYLTEVSERQMAGLAPRDPESLADFRRVAGGALAAILHTSLPRPGEVEAVKHGGEELEGGIRLEKLALSRKGSGEEVPALLLRPRSWNGTVIVAASEQGKEACFAKGELEEDARVVLASGAALLVPDLFLTGEYLPRAEGDGGGGSAADLFPVDARRHKSYVGYTYGYNRTLLAQRVHDLLSTVAYARSLDGARAVHLIGVKKAGSWAILARALAGDAVRRTLVSDLLDFTAVDSSADPSFLPGALKYGGMPAFAALCAPGELRLAGVAPPPLVVAAYAAAGARDAVRGTALSPGVEAELIEWLSAAPGKDP
jgi:hypothetical protein